MTSTTLEKTAPRVALTLARRAIARTYLPGDDALEPHQRAVCRVLVRIQALENALLDLELTVRENAVDELDLPF